MGLGQKPLAAGADAIAEVILGQELQLIMQRYADRSDCGRYDRTLEVIVDRPAALFASWYEMWPRSQGNVEGRSATFADMEASSGSRSSAWGFDVIYLPPIHPIGRTNRKGPNNSLICPPGSPGCPYAIGNELGGHTAIEPELGTLEDFRRFERACRGRGMELALDLALQTSPDHPWVAEHPEWFRKRPDGSIKFAENPPKKYEDIYPLDFNTSDREGLWREILAVVRFWMDQGVRIFRVDNPHTKPVLFWELADRRDPPHGPGRDLSGRGLHPTQDDEGAGQGRLHPELHLLHLAQLQAGADRLLHRADPVTEVAEYMRGNLFTNTPDILPEVLQNAPALGVQDAGHSRRHPQLRCGACTTASSSARGHPCRARRSTWTRRSTSTRSGTGIVQATSRTSSPASTAFARSNRRCSSTATCASTRPTTTT